MFTARYYAPRQYAPRYFAEIGATILVTRFVALTLAARPSYTIGACPEYAIEPRPTLEIE
jgi:hypothetical protein